LTLLANNRLVARDKHSSLFGLNFSIKEKEFFNNVTFSQHYKDFFSSSLTLLENKLEHLSRESFLGVPLE
jgi:hypothetical protein